MTEQHTCMRGCKTQRFLQSQIDQWRLAHGRWSMEKLRLEAKIDEANANLWLSEDRGLALEAALKRVMRNQARLLQAWAETERYDEDSDVAGEVAASRDLAKAALRYPQSRFSQRLGDSDA